MAHIKDLLPSILEIDDWKVDLARHWDQVVGTLQTRIRLEKIYGDTVIIGVYESHWMQELYLLSSVLRDSINSYIGEQRIAHLRFKLVEDRKRTVRKSPPKRPHRPMNVALSKSQKDALAGIVDEKLKEVLTDFWGRCTLYNAGDSS